MLHGLFVLAQPDQGLAQTAAETDGRGRVLHEGHVEVGRLLMVDALSMRFETLRYKRDPQNPLNGDVPGINDLSGHR